MPPDPMCCHPVVTLLPVLLPLKLLQANDVTDVATFGTAISDAGLDEDAIPVTAKVKPLKINPTDAMVVDWGHWLILIQKSGKMDEIAGVVAYITTPEAGFITADVTGVMTTRHRWRKTKLI